MATLEYHVPEMVGRDKELDRLKGFLHAAIDGQGNTIFVSGEAGIGKTRLVEELEIYARSIGLRVLNGRCLHESPTAFLPFREALGNVFQVSKNDGPSVQQRKVRKIARCLVPLLCVEVSW